MKIGKHPTEHERSMPFEQINKDWTMIKVPEMKLFIGLKIIVNDVTKFVHSDGETYINEHGKPSMNMDQKISVEYFTLENGKKIIEEQNRKYYK